MRVREGKEKTWGMAELMICEEEKGEWIQGVKRFLEKSGSIWISSLGVAHIVWNGILSIRVLNIYKHSNRQYFQQWFGQRLEIFLCSYYLCCL